MKRTILRIAALALAAVVAAFVADAPALADIGQGLGDVVQP